MMKTRGMALFSLTAALGLGLSQYGSHLIETYIDIHESVVVTSFLHLTHVRNEGGVFGVFQGKGWVFAAFSIFFLSALTFYVYKDKRLRGFEYICYGLITAGGTSNILDRFIYGSVIDFIDVKGIPGWFYVFNTADVLIHLGIWPLLILGFFLDKPPIPESLPETEKVPG